NEQPAVRAIHCRSRAATTVQPRLRLGARHPSGWQSQMTLQLASMQPFARGGHRLCFVHPDNPALCVKVRRPDFSLADRRRKKGFPKNLRPLSSFDDNAEEFRVMTDLERAFGEPLYKHVSRCHGFAATDMGPGLVSELIRNDS